MHLPAWLFVVFSIGSCVNNGADRPETDHATDPIDQEARVPGSFGDTSYRTLDSITFTAKGQRFDLIILKHIAEDADTNRRWEGVRPLLLFGYQDGVRDLLLRNDSLILCRTCGGIFGDPYDGVGFANDTLQVHHYGGSAWRWSITHAFVPGAEAEWPLVRRTAINYSVYEPDSSRTVNTALPSTGLRLRDCNSYR